MKLDITLLGDIFPGNLHYTVGYGVANKFPEKDYSDWLRRISFFTVNSDLTLCNLEAPLLNYIDKPRKGMFKGEPHFANFLYDSNVRLVNIANNHIYEHGDYGFNSTLDILNNVGINYIGDKDKNVFIYNKNEIRVGFAGFNNIHNQKGILPYSKVDKDLMLSKIKLLESKNCDYKIFSIHWGDEFISRPSLEQISLARFLIDNGVNIIHGHHPHVVQSIQSYNGGLIFYSLGNFIFDMIWHKTVRQGIAVKLELEKTGGINYRIVPYVIDDDYLPEYVDGGRTDILSEITINANYDKSYKKELKKLLLKQRILMKMFLLKNMFKGNFKPIKFIYASKKCK